MRPSSSIQYYTKDRDAIQVWHGRVVPLPKLMGFHLSRSVAVKGNPQRPSMNATAAETWQQYCESLPQLALSSIDAAPLTALVKRSCSFTSTSMLGTCHKFSPLATDSLPDLSNIPCEKTYAKHGQTSSNRLIPLSKNNSYPYQSVSWYTEGRNARRSREL